MEEQLWSAFNGDIPLTRHTRHQLEHSIREAVTSGRLAPDAQLPPAKDLSYELQLARSTVYSAYDRLIAEGYLAGDKKTGPVVAQDPPGRARRAESGEAGSAAELGEDSRPY